MQCMHWAAVQADLLHASYHVRAIIATGLYTKAQVLTLALISLV